MKKMRRLTFMLPALLLAACTGNESQDFGSMETTTATYLDTTKFVSVNLSLELPTDTDTVTQRIRDMLMEEFANHAKWFYGICEEGFEPPAFPEYTGDKNDVQTFVNHYGDEIKKRMTQNANELYESLLSDMTEEEEEPYFRQYRQDVKIEKTMEAADFVVFYADCYNSYGGGQAISDGDTMIFDRHTGHRISRFIKEDAAPEMQPLIRQGLLSYFSDENMTDEELDRVLALDEDCDYIPLPHSACIPNATGDSLKFTYQMWEITYARIYAPYFTLAVKDLLPYMTEEGKKMLEK